MPLVWGARLLGVPLPGRVAGSDFIPLLAERAAHNGYSMYFLGAAEGIAECAAGKIKQQHPDLIIAGVHSPPKSSIMEMDPGIVDAIITAQPDILLVAFGNPKQEKWIGMYGPQLGVPVMIGVGGTLDFIAGNKKRAPMWMQRTGFEWLYRLLQEPQRLWKRYVIDGFIFGIFLARQWWNMRKGLARHSNHHSTSSMMIERTAVINVQGYLAIDNIQDFDEVVQNAVSETSLLIVNLDGAEFLDNSAIGRLVGLANQTRRVGGELSLVAVPLPIKETLSLLRLENFFRIYTDLDDAMEANSLLEKEGSSLIQVREVALFSNDGIDWTIVRGPRRFDGVTTPQVVEKLSTLVRKKPFLVLDLSATVCLTSAGLMGLESITRLADAHNGELRVVTQSEDLSKVIQMEKFDNVLSLYKDLFSATV
jgi:N-acetylglucosaminyldiphosphoundecaprenol N-acetyl-beta-D-mannosaminyltransferase